MPKPKKPPYLAFVLDALPAARNAALAAGLPRAEGPDALLSLWEHAWRQQVEWVPATVMLGCCSGHERLPEALRAFGFLEPVAAGWTSPPVTPDPIPVDGYRIKGARRYLRVGSPQSLGGQAAKGNLIPGARYRTSAERKGAEEQPASRPPLGCLSADVSADSRHQRAATSDERAAESQHLAGASGDPPGDSPAQGDLRIAPLPGKRREAAGKREKPPPDPRRRELSDRLVATYKRVTGHAYAFQDAKDGMALGRLVGMLSAALTVDGLDRRFEAGLRSRFGTVTGIADFASRPNDPRWGGEVAAPRDVRRGTVRAEDEHHEQGGSVSDF